MVSYNIVKYCKLCKTRFVVPKEQSKTNYCPSCQEKFNKEKELKLKELKVEKAKSDELKTQDTIAEKVK